MVRARIPILCLCSLAVHGCALPGNEASFDSIDPTARSHAALEAAKRDDRRSIPALITMLGSSDPALRLIAAETLERLTGRTFGYEASAPVGEREDAVERWVRWWESSGGGARGGELD